MHNVNIFFFVVLQLYSAVILYASDSEDYTRNISKDIYKNIMPVNEEHSAYTNKNIADHTHESMENYVGALATWVNAFFDDPDYTEEKADARINLKQSIKISDKKSVKFHTHISGAAHLPNASKRHCQEKCVLSDKRGEPIGFPAIFNHFF
jgi:hypothetical protein